MLPGRAVIYDVFGRDRGFVKRSKEVTEVLYNRAALGSAIKAIAMKGIAIYIHIYICI